MDQQDAQGAGGAGSDPRRRDPARRSADREVDRRLILQARKGSPEAAEELVRRHLPRAFRVAVLVAGDRDRAQDIVQDAFESALKALSGFDPSRPFAPWLHRIVTNKAIDAFRREPQAPAMDLDLVPGRDPYDLSAASRELLGALRSLPDDRRVVVVLRLVFGYTPDEVSQMLGVRVGTVHSRLSRGLGQLRKEIGVPDEA